MNMRAMGFEVDRTRGKLLGVCAGLAARTGLDVTIIRVAVVLAALVGSFTWVAILYLGAAFVGSRAVRCKAVARPVDSDEARQRMRSHELRMQAIETYTSSSNSRLAREIEELR